MLVEARRAIQRDRLALIEGPMARPAFGAIAKPLSRHAIDRIAVRANDMQCVRHIAPYHVDLEAWCPAREATLIGINFGVEMALATSLGLPVSADLPDNVWKLLKLNPQPVRILGSGGVEYLPVERRASMGRRWTRQDGLRFTNKAGDRRTLRPDRAISPI
jgi:hypothetical protein